MPNKSLFLSVKVYCEVGFWENTCDAGKYHILAFNMPSLVSFVFPHFQW